MPNFAEFEKALSHLINRYSVDSWLDLADWEVSEHIVSQLTTLHTLFLKRDQHIEFFQSTRRDKYIPPPEDKK